MITLSDSLTTRTSQDRFNCFDKGLTRSPYFTARSQAEARPLDPHPDLVETEPLNRTLLESPLRARTLPESSSLARLLLESPSLAGALLESQFFRAPLRRVPLFGEKDRGTRRVCPGKGWPHRGTRRSGGSKKGDSAQAATAARLEKGLGAGRGLNAARAGDAPSQTRGLNPRRAGGAADAHQAPPGMPPQAPLQAHHAQKSPGPHLSDPGLWGVPQRRSRATR